MKSTNKSSSYCPDCCTVIDSRTRSEQHVADNAAKAVERGSAKVLSVATLISNDTFLTRKEAWKISQVFATTAEQNVSGMTEEETVLASEMHELMADSVHALQIQRDYETDFVAVDASSSAGTGQNGEHKKRLMSHFLCQQPFFLRNL